MVFIFITIHTSSHAADIPAVVKAQEQSSWYSGNLWHFWQEEKREPPMQLL